MSKQMPKNKECSQTCLREGKICEVKECRYSIDYPEDLNCSLVCVAKNGVMTLSEVSKRLNISLVRVSQIEKHAIKKLSKRTKI